MQQVETLRATLAVATRPLVGFGCPAKAALLIETVGVRFDYLADDTPSKIGRYTPGIPCEIRPLAGDASFRRYFGVHRGNGETAVLMDAPPAHEDVGPFLAAATPASASAVGQG